MLVNDTHVFFFKGVYSNWFESEFVVQGVKFNCVEQYMMYKKARLFGDGVMASKIMKADHPSRQKQLGRMVKNFDKRIWDRHKYDIVYEGNYFKYTQNIGLLKDLLAYKGKTYVEASPWDEIWGVKMDETDPRITDPKNWQGENLLGFILTDLANDLGSVEHYRNLGVK